MSRIRESILEARKEGRKVMGLFMTNGFPEMDDTLDILLAAAEGGADFIELGMPFSDPLAEGLPIQQSSERALKNGVTMQDAFRVAAAFRAKSEIPLLLMGYINPVFRYGISNFFSDAQSSGVDGLILPDVPPEEAGLIKSHATQNQIDLIYLVAPNTPEHRISEAGRNTTGFLYAVSMTGLTGTSIGATNAVQTYLKQTRATLQSDTPLLVGFGIKNHDDAMRLSTHTDGYIVGSALIKEVERLWDDPSLTKTTKLQQVKEWVFTLKHGALPHQRQP